MDFTARIVLTIHKEDFENVNPNVKLNNCVDIVRIAIPGMTVDKFQKSGVYQSIKSLLKSNVLYITEE